MSNKTSNTPQTLSIETLMALFSEIKEHNTKEIRFCFLLGAGASKSSGIDTGWEISTQWYKELKEQ